MRVASSSTRSNREAREGPVGVAEQDLVSGLVRRSGRPSATAQKSARRTGSRDMNVTLRSRSTKRSVGSGTPRGLGTGIALVARRVGAAAAPRASARGTRVPRAGSSSMIASMIRLVSSSTFLYFSSTRLADADADRRRVGHVQHVRDPALRGHTCSVPHMPTGITGRGHRPRAAPRPTGPSARDRRTRALAGSCPAA